MKKYLAIFHTYLSAMLTYKKLVGKNIDVYMQVVPRKVSSSCGTCVVYDADDIMLECMDTDYEAVYEVLDEDSYIEIEKNKN